LLQVWHDTGISVDDVHNSPQQCVDICDPTAAAAAAAAAAVAAATDADGSGLCGLLFADAGPSVTLLAIHQGD
jgi:hypothetical protein